MTGPNPAGATVEDFRAVTDEAGVDDAVIQLINDGEGFRVQTDRVSIPTPKTTFSTGSPRSPETSGPICRSMRSVRASGP